MTRQVLTVTSNADSGAGSLRAALQQTQRNLGNYDIVFSGNTRGENNGLGTGFFTIKLNSALPNLWRGDIRINTDPSRSRSVTILPASAAGGSGTLSTRMQPLTTQEEGSVSPSLLTIGDIRNLYGGAETFNQKSSLNVEINGVNFVRNRAQGGNGYSGGGGGLGAGGAITFLNGTLKIANSVFQDLNARAGTGNTFARGGNGSLVKNSVVKQRNSNGQNGGNGGISSIPTGKNYSDELFYDPKFISIGGSGGRRGLELNLLNEDPYFPTAGPSVNGERGKAARNAGPGGANFFGFGGGGGGGGGDYSAEAASTLPHSGPQMPIILEGGKFKGQKGKKGPAAFATVIGPNGRRNFTQVQQVALLRGHTTGSGLSPFWRSKSRNRKTYKRKQNKRASSRKQKQ